MRIVLAPDKFKGTLSARSAAAAMESGVRAVLPDADIVALPMADGGEGTVEVLASISGAGSESLRVAGGPEVWDAPVAYLPDGSACIEVATTSMRSASEDALTAGTSGTGDALRALYDRHPKRILVAIGGTSSTDGGAGLARSHGWRFLDERGTQIEPGGAALRSLALIDGSEVLPPSCEVVGLCDVGNPLIGASGAARTFASQKGASASDIEVLEDALTHLAQVVEAQLGLPIAAVPMAGAGGGTAAGLVAFLGATLVSGFDFVATACGLEDHIAQADLVITGEGGLDVGNLQGKVSTGVARLARAHGVPVLAICGEVKLDPAAVESLGFARATSVGAATDPEKALTTVTEKVMTSWIPT